MRWFLFLFLSCLSNTNYSLINVSDITIYDTFALGPPVQQAKWHQDPRVRVCTTAEVAFHRVSAAIKYWEMLGYRFGGIAMDESLNCGTPRHGEIIITLPDPGIDPKHIAATRIYTEKISGYIAKAQVFIYPNQSKKQRVLEHEMGHALGWMHHRAKFHIMHPNWMEGGYGHTGLRKERD